MMMQWVCFFIFSQFFVYFFYKILLQLFSLPLILERIQQNYPEIPAECLRRLVVSVSMDPTSFWGLGLAGHRKRQRLSCFVAAIDTKGFIAASGLDLQAGDEILEINGHRLRDRSHLNVPLLIRNLDAEDDIVLITARQSSEMSIKPLQKFPHNFPNKINVHLMVSIKYRIA